MELPTGSLTADTIGEAPKSRSSGLNSVKSRSSGLGVSDLSLEGVGGIGSWLYSAFETRELSSVVSRTVDKRSFKGCHGSSGGLSCSISSTSGESTASESSSPVKGSAGSVTNDNSCSVSTDFRPRPSLSSLSCSGISSSNSVTAGIDPYVSPSGSRLGVMDFESALGSVGIDLSNPS